MRMRKTAAALAGGALTLGLLAVGSPARAETACATPDVTAPVVSNVAVTRAPVIGVTGGSALVDFTVTDACGVAVWPQDRQPQVDVLVERVATPDDHFEFGLASARLSGTAQNGRFRVALAFEPFDLPGTWRVSEVVAADAAGNVGSAAGPRFIAKAQGRASVRVSATTVSKGTPVTVTAGVAYAWNGAYKPASNQAVRAEVRLAGAGNPWLSLGTKTTDSRGLASFTHRPNASVEYRVVYAGTATVSASVTSARLVRVS